MPVHAIAFAALWQADDISGKDVHWISIWLGIISIALLVGAIGLVFTSIFAARLLHSVDCVVKEAKEHTGPLLEKTNALVQELGPRIQALTENAEQISYSVRAKVDEIGVTVTQINATVQEVSSRTRKQVAHVDGIVSQALHSAEEISHTVQESIKVPVRQVVGIVAGVKAGLEKLIELSPFARN